MAVGNYAVALLTVLATFALLPRHSEGALLELTQKWFLGNFSNCMGTSSPWNIPDDDSVVIDCSTLAGVTCYSDGSIAAIKLSSKQLTGTLPANIDLLQFMWNLDLRFNQFFGPLPDQIVELKKLQYLLLNDNQFSGTFPDGFGSKFIAMNNLFLQNNQFTGVIPDTLGKVLLVKNMYLANNGFYGSLPSTFSKLVNLEILDVSKNQLTGSIPSSILTLKKLTNFNVQNNYFTGPQIPVKYNNPNCWSNVKDSQRNALCSSFCGTMSLLGPCAQFGSCVINDTTNLPYCLCYDGYQVDPAAKFQCIPINKYKVGFIPSNVTMNSVNSYSRHISYRYNPAKDNWLFQNSADWTYGTWGIRSQGPCSSCWAVSAMIAFENLAYIFQTKGLTNPTTLYSVQQVLDCNRLSAQIGCAGGWPEAAFEYIAGRSGALVKDKVYPYNASVGDCQNNLVSSSSVKPFVGVYFEKIDFFGWFGVLIALQRQPLVAFVSGSAPSFQNYITGVFSDSTCFSRNLIDHSVVLMGYELKAFTPYWILRNSWGIYWGMLGDMKMAITGGQGVCGIHTIPAVYPVISGPTPCTNPINPCGSGTCIPIKGTNKNWCQCSGSKFVNVTNIDGTQSCALKDICSTFFYNPCGSGSCINDLLGSYNCICPLGYNLTTKTDGTQSCSWNGGKASPSPLLVTIPKQASCKIVYSMYGLTRAQFQKQNPKLDCSKLQAGSIVNVTPPSNYKCTLWYSWQDSDTCASVLSSKNLNVTTFLALNPALGSCVDGTIAPAQQICVSSSPSITPLPFCSQRYQMKDGETCASVAKKFGLDMATFQAMNPGVNCELGSLTNNTYIKTTTMEVCVAAFTRIATCSSCPTKYLIARGDTCASIKTYQYKSSGTLMSSCNGGWTCADTSIYVGLSLCTPSSSIY